MGARIGGNVSDICDAAGIITQTGTAATSAGKDAASVTQQMDRRIADVTSMLTQHFNQMAEDLRHAITQACHRLGATDWEGRSKHEATRVESELNQQVNRVLGQALESTQQFQAQMRSRAGDFVSAVQGDFQTIMGNVDAAYQDLAKASQAFAENLQAADESIRFTQG
jgi:ElaB/YqjD/DUF883 family membrane-anchored ribosome-binding protein